MIRKNLTNTKEQKLSNFLGDEMGLGYNQAQKLIRNKDVKVNGKRVSKNFDLIAGDEVEVYLNEKRFNVVFETDDIVVVFKPRNIETVSETNEDLKSGLENQLRIELFAVHRLDRNTEGLVVFAKNIKAKLSLNNAIKNRKLQKFYYARVYGIPRNHEEKLVAYLKKDEKNSLVYISDKKQTGYDEIKTNYTLIVSDGETSVLSVELVTGKTHQIRAHLSHIGLPILGDEKYGNQEVNKKYRKRYQELCAYKIIFHFDKDDVLSYLDNQIVKIQNINDYTEFSRNNT